MLLDTRSLSLLAAVGLTALSLPAVATAQAPDSSRSSVRVRAAGGVDLGIGDTYPWRGSVVGVLGLEWLHPRAPFSTRLDLSYFRDARDYGDVAGACAPFCVYGERFEMLGLSIDGRYTFLSRSPVRPYLLSGFGLYRSTTTVTASYACRMNTCTATPGERSTFSSSSLAPGLHAGFGFAVPIRRSELSLEFRFQQLTSGIRYGHTVPITLGIRF